MLDAGMSFIKNNVLMWIMSIKDNVVKRKRTTELHLKTKTNSCKGINEAWMIQCPHLLCLLCWLDATWFIGFDLIDLDRVMLWSKILSKFSSTIWSIKTSYINIAMPYCRLKQNTTFKLQNPHNIIRITNRLIWIDGIGNSEHDTQLRR